MAGSHLLGHDSDCSNSIEFVQVYSRNKAPVVAQPAKQTIKVQKPPDFY